MLVEIERHATRELETYKDKQKKKVVFEGLILNLEVGEGMVRVLGSKIVKTVWM